MICEKSVTYRSEVNKLYASTSLCCNSSCWTVGPISARTNRTVVHNSALRIETSFPFVRQPSFIAATVETYNWWCIDYAASETLGLAIFYVFFCVVFSKTCIAAMLTISY